MAKRCNKVDRTEEEAKGLETPLLRSYKCPVCGNWHMASSREVKGRQRARETERLKSEISWIEARISAIARGEAPAL